MRPGRPGAVSPRAGPGMAVRMLNVPLLSSTIAVISDSCAWPSLRATCRSCSVETRAVRHRSVDEPLVVGQGRGRTREPLEAVAAGSAPGDRVLPEQQHRERGDALGQRDRLGQQRRRQRRAQRYGDDQVEGVQLGQRPLPTHPQHRRQVRRHAQYAATPTMTTRPSPDQLWNKMWPMTLSLTLSGCGHSRTGRCSHPSPRNAAPRPSRAVRSGRLRRLYTHVKAGTGSRSPLLQRRRRRGC